MQTQEIPNEQWGPFLDNITRRHEGEPVSIEVQGKDLGAQEQASGVRLIGITFDPKDSIGDEIEVMVRNDVNAHLMHAITHPAHVRIARTDDGADAALQVESRDGPTTLVRFDMPPSQQTGDNRGGA